MGELRHRLRHEALAPDRLHRNLEPAPLTQTAGIGARRLALLILSSVLCLPSSVSAHPIKTGYAEADYRRDPARLEIAIRLFTDDVETALTQRARKKITFTKTPAAEIDALLLAAVRAAFIVKSPDGTKQTLTWVGREFKDGDQHLWLYVECPLPGGVAGARINHRLLRDTFSDQLNSVIVRDAGPPSRQVTLLFMQDAEQVVAFPK